MITTTEIKVASLHAALDAVRRFASKDSSRPHLNAVCLDFAPKVLTVVTTNGHTMARYTMPIKCEHTVSCVVPLDAAEMLRKSIKHFVKADPVASLNVFDTHINVLIDGTTLRVELVDERFPPYNSVIPTYNHDQADASVGVTAQYLTDACAAFGGKNVILKMTTQGAPDPIVITVADTSPCTSIAGFVPENLTIVIMPARLD